MWRSFLDDINLRSKVLLNILIGGRLQLRHIKQSLSQIAEKKNTVVPPDVDILSIQKIVLEHKETLIRLKFKHI